MNYWLYILIQLELFTVLAYSARQPVHTSGLFYLCAGAFAGVGAYATAILMTGLGWSYWATLPIVLASSLILGLLISLIANRLRNIYFCLASLAIQIIFSGALHNWDALTNGPSGLSGIQPPRISNFPLYRNVMVAFLAALLLLGVAGYHTWLRNTPLHTLTLAARDNERMLISTGLNPAYYKRISILTSAITAGLAGSLLSLATGAVVPKAFSLDMSILVLSMSIIGGARPWGPLLGAALFVLLPEGLKLLDMQDQDAANLRLMLFGLLLVILVRKRDYFSQPSITPVPVS